MKLHTVFVLFLLALLPVVPMHAQAVQAVADIAAADSLSALPVSDSVPPVQLTYPQILLDMSGVHVEQDSLVTLLMEEKMAGVERGQQERAGFRVQIYSSNHPQYGKSGALLLEERVKQALSVSVYVIYASPSWKVRIGDFLTEDDAIRYRDMFKQLFPDLADYTYVVRDQVKIR